MIFSFKRFSIKFCIWKYNRFFSVGWVSPIKTVPQSKKGYQKKKKWHQNLNNTSFNRATTTCFWPIVKPELGAFENVVLTWPLDFCLQAYFLSKKVHFYPKNGFFLINFVIILWFIWDLALVLFDSHKDAVSGKILVFGKILGFPGINWEQKWTKPFNFG